MELCCTVQPYAWGKLGSTSSVAKLSGKAIDENLPYAELWMGTHPSGPCILKDSNVSLKQYLSENQGLLSIEEAKRFGGDLSFLFKVLSVAKALSIQAHPNKKHAEILHQLKPEHYKDDNHKPEMAIPVFGEFEALCGFRPVAEIASFAERIPALQKILGDHNVNLLTSANPFAVKECFSTLMKCSDDVVKEASASFRDWLKSKECEEKSSVLGELFERISADFPDDVGCFCIYFLNHIKLGEGEAMFLGPNIPHAYLYGDCIECMACSDNVVRAGLTPKFKDVETLCDMLEYESGTKESYLIQWERDDNYTETCRAPVPDFAVGRITIPDPSVTYELLPRNASIIIILNGTAKTDGKTLQPGSTLFIPAGKRIKILVEHAPFIAYQAFSNVGFNIVDDFSEKGSCLNCIASK